MDTVRPLCLALVLRVACAIHPPPPPAFELGGACAGVKTRETWKDDDDTHHWTYKIKVQPWTLFGRITVTLHGWGMQLDKTYYGYVETPGKQFDVLLHPRAGPDDIFEIQGTGESYADPDVQCSGLQLPNATTPECALVPQFEIESDWESIQSGRFRAHVHMNLWCVSPQAPARGILQPPHPASIARADALILTRDRPRSERCENSRGRRRHVIESSLLPPATQELPGH
eukprot:7380061-Prymnesium_polylepis.1